MTHGGIRWHHQYAGWESGVPAKSIYSWLSLRIERTIQLGSSQLHYIVRDKWRKTRLQTIQQKIPSTAREFSHLQSRAQHATSAPSTGKTTLPPGAKCNRLQKKF
jgi:hypothetical protein